MNTIAAITIAVFIGLVGLYTFYTIRWNWRQEQERQQKQREAERIALRCDPAYTQMEERDRAHYLAMQQLELQKERQAIELSLQQQQFHLNQYLALTRATPEQYLLDYQPRSITPLPSLKKPVTVAEVTQASPDNLRVPTFSELRQCGMIAEGKPLVIGMKQNGEIRVGSWLDLYTLAVAGVAGTGKSTSVLFYLLQAVLHGARLVMIDPHAESKPDSLARRLSGLPPSCYIGKIAITNQEILSRVRSTTSELKRRQKTGKGHPIILVVDEFTRLMRTREIAEELGELLEAIAQEGRGYNIFALLTGQVWTATRTGGTELRYSIASSLIHRIQEAQAALLIPSKYAKHCPELKTGEALLYDTNGQSEILSIPLTTITDVMEVSTFLGTSEGSSGGTSWGSSGGTSYTLPESKDELPLNEGGKHSEVDTEPLEVPPFSGIDTQVLDCMCRGVSQNQIMAEVFGIDKPGTAYQQKLPALRRAIQRIAQYTKAQQEKIGV